MTQWFTVRKSDDRVVGWSRGGNSVPADTDSTAHVETTPEAIEQFEAASRTARSGGRDIDIKLVGGVPTLQADARPLFDITADKSSCAAGGTITLTVRALTAGGALRSSYNATVVSKFGTRRLELTFVNGVASKTLTAQAGQDINFTSERGYRLVSPLSIDVYE